MSQANVVFFDLETQKSADEVGGWKNIHLMKMSVGVVYETGPGEYRVFEEDQVQDLIAALKAADMVVGFNVIRFDYTVLSGYTPEDLTQIPTFDLLQDLERRLGHRVKLDDVASATLGTSKSGHGLQALRWWKEGKVQEIIDYCRQDVKVTKEVYEFGVDRGFVSFFSRYGGKERVPVQWPKL